MTTMTRTARALGFTLAVLLLAGCADETLTEPDLIQSDDPAVLAADDAQAAAKRGRIFVLNTQLRPVEAEVPSEAHGHLQLKIRQVSGITPDDGYEVAWKGKLFNPAGELFTDGDVKGITPDDIRPVLRVFDARSSEEVIVVEGAGLLPAEQAERLIASPGDFGVVFATVALPGGVLAGDFSGVEPNPF